MATGLSPKLPLSFGEEANYSLNKEYEEMIAQNLKNLILTSPGERMMDPLFGVGLKRFLFSMSLEQVYGEISSKIVEQVNIYMPFLAIHDVIFNKDDEDETKIYVTVQYSIVPLALEQELSLLVAA